MAKTKLTAEELAERSRLVAWMKANGYTSVTLAAATGDFYNNVQTMTEGKRRISQGFKWRLRRAFGNQLVDEMFPQEAPVREVELA